MGKGEIGLPKLVLLGVTQRTFSKRKKGVAGSWGKLCLADCMIIIKTEGDFIQRIKAEISVKLSANAKKRVREYFFQERIVTIKCTSQENTAAV